MEMRNEEGEVLAILNIDSSQEDNTIDRIVRQLKPGMGKGIYLAADKNQSANKLRSSEVVGRCYRVNDKTITMGARISC